MELIIHDLDNEKLDNLKWKIEKKEKIIDLFQKLNTGSLNEELIGDILKFLKIMTN